MSPAPTTPPFNEAPKPRGGRLPLDLRLMRLAATAMVSLTAVAALVSAGHWLVHRPMFAFASVRLAAPALHHGEEALAAQILPRLQGNFFTQDLGLVRQQVEAMAWVRHATVSKIWPNRLVIQIDEYQPTALWEREGADPLVVDPQGRLFEVNLGDLEDEDLPTLRGPEGSPAEVLAMWHRLTPVLAGLKAPIHRVELSDRGSWQIELDENAVIQIGRGSPEEVQLRTERFARSVGQLSGRFQHRKVEYADLRHNEGYAVRLAGMTTTDNAKTRKSR